MDWLLDCEKKRFKRWGMCGPKTQPTNKLKLVGKGYNSSSNQIMIHKTLRKNPVVGSQGMPHTVQPTEKNKYSSLTIAIEVLFTYVLHNKMMR